MVKDQAPVFNVLKKKEKDMKHNNGYVKMSHHVGIIDEYRRNENLPLLLS